MPSEMSPDLMIKIATVVAALYMVYVFIKDRYGKK